MDDDEHQALVARDALDEPVPLQQQDDRDAANNVDADDNQVQAYIKAGEGIVPIGQKPINCCGKCQQQCSNCLQGCCHDCQSKDKVLFVLHILVIAAAATQATLAIKSKINTHNQCYLMATYFREGSVDYTKSLLWCDATMYMAMVTLMLAFLFMMVNWTAQLNRNAIWMSIKLFLHFVGLAGTVTAGIVLLVAYNTWCSQVSSARYSGLPIQFKNLTRGSCLDNAMYFDEDKNEDTMLQTLYTFTIALLSVSLVCIGLWFVTFIVALFHFFENYYNKEKQLPYEPPVNQPDNAAGFIHPENYQVHVNRADGAVPRQAQNRADDAAPHQAQNRADDAALLHARNTAVAHGVKRAAQNNAVETAEVYTNTVDA